MKYRVNRTALGALGIAVVLFVLRTLLIVSGDTDSSVEQIDAAQNVINLLLDYLVTLIAFVISATQSWQNRKTNRAAFFLNAFAVVCCASALFVNGRIEIWRECGTYFSLFFILLGLCMEPKDNAENIKQEFDEKKLTKLAVLILAVIMLLIVICSFVKGTPAFMISDGIVYVFILVIVLLVWDSIETFSLGSIVSLNKTVKAKEKEVTQLSTENRELRAQILTVVQHSQNTSFNMSIGGREAKVEPVTQDDSTKDKNDFDALKMDVVIGADPRDRMPESMRRRLPLRIENYAIDKFVLKNNIPTSDLQKEVKLSSKFINSDPIMIRNIIFDAYAKRPLGDIFIESALPSPRLVSDERLYYMLAKVHQYALASRSEAKLMLIIPQLPKKCADNEAHHFYRDPERIIKLLNERYEPAIRNGLLEIALIEITEEELSKLNSQVNDEESTT